MQLLFIAFVYTAKQISSKVSREGFLYDGLYRYEVCALARVTWN